MSIQRTIGLAALLVLSACGSARQTADEETSPPPTGATAGCNRCHGSAVNAAPPGSVSGATQVSDRSVGAHQRHLVGLTTRKPLDCVECHVVPRDLVAPGHLDGVVSVVFDGPGSSGVARAGGAQPAWNRETATCSSVYCHGSTFMGAAAIEPVWTSEAGPKLLCGGCHGLPPPRSTGHPAANACPQCHDSLRYDGTLELDKHIDGVVQLATGSCTTCHGDPARQPSAIAPAPPLDSGGNTSSPAVGAHLRHLTGGAVAGAMPCNACHVAAADAAHINGTAAPVFSGLAVARGARAAWDPTQRTCTSYCHGSSMGGGTRTSPSWGGGAAEAACGSCHGLAPTTRHPDVTGGVTTCAGCHPTTARPDGSIDVAGGRHVNGVVDVDFTARGCASCHGGTLSGTDADGIDISAAPRNGAHARHLTTPNARLRCSDCHGVLPTSMTHADGQVQLSFRGIAAGTQWNGTTCSTSYCHGAFRNGLNGGAGAVVSWAPPAPAPLGCTSCHNRPHYQPHSGGDECWICHEHVNPSSNGFIAPALHVNGQREHMNCSIGCHAF